MSDLTWLTSASPWIQGLFGGIGVTVLWEGFIQPARERRSLAHILADEVALNLQYTAGQRLYLESHPKQLPGDFSCYTVVFSAVASRLGELPVTAAETILYYAGLEALNDLPRQYGDALGRQKVAQLEKDRLKDLPSLEEELNLIMGVYRSGLEKAVERANQLLPKLRRGSVPWYHVQIWPREKPKVLELSELAERVNQLSAQRRNEARGG